MEVVKEKEGIKLGDLVVAEGPLQMDTRPFNRRLTLPHFFYFSRHDHEPPPEGAYKVPPSFYPILTAFEVPRKKDRETEIQTEPKEEGLHFLTV